MKETGAMDTDCHAAQRQRSEGHTTGEDRKCISSATGQERDQRQLSGIQLELITKHIGENKTWSFG